MLRLYGRLAWVRRQARPLSKPRLGGREAGQQAWSAVSWAGRGGRRRSIVFEGVAKTTPGRAATAFRGAPSERQVPYCKHSLNDGALGRPRPSLWLLLLGPFKTCAYSQQSGVILLNRNLAATSVLSGSEWSPNPRDPAHGGVRGGNQVSWRFGVVAVASLRGGSIASSSV